MSCLDAWAVIALVKDEEPAATRIQQEIERGRPVISWINLVEVHYDLIRRQGREAADNTIAELRDVLEAELPGVERMRAAASLKAENPISLADCFAIATAAARSLPLWTGDPEIIERQESLPCEVVDLRD